MGIVIDSGDFETVLDQALELADWNGFPARRAQAEKTGRRRGIGISLYFECSGGGPKEYASIKFDRDGGVMVAVGSQSNGMGHETALPQILADKLGLDFEKVRYGQADTDLTPIGGGHGGSRGLAMGGSAVSAAADKGRGQAKRPAAHMLETAEADLEFAKDADGRGRFTVAEIGRAHV